MDRKLDDIDVAQQHRSQETAPRAEQDARPSPRSAANGLLEKKISRRIARKQNMETSAKPMIDQAERSLGAPLDVRLHTGDKVAESHGAAAVTQGKDIHFSEAAVHPTAGPEPGLLGHELVHAAQQQNPGDHPGGSLEGEADRGARAIAHGERFRVTGATGGATPQAKDFKAWFMGVFGGQDLEATERWAELQGVGKVPEQEMTYLGSGEKVLGSDGEPVMQSAPQADVGASWTSFDPTHGDWLDHQHSLERQSVDDAQMTSERRHEVRKGATGRTTTDAKRESIEVPDVDAMAGQAREQIDEKVKQQTARQEQLEKALQEKEAAQAGVVASAADPELARLRGEAARVKADLAALKASRQALEQPLDEKALATLAARHGLRVKPEKKTVFLDEVTEEEAYKWGLGGISGRRTRTTERQIDALGVKEPKREDQRSWNVDLLGGSGGWEQAHAETAATDSGSVEEKGTRGGEVALGEGITYSAKQGHSTVISDGDGRTEAMREQSSTMDYQAIFRPGEYGVGVGRRTEDVHQIGDDATKVNTAVGGSLTNRGVAGTASAGLRRSGKRSEHEVKTALDGGLTVDAMWDEDSGRYLLVVTLRAGASLGAGETLKRETEKPAAGDYRDRPQAKGSVGVTVGAKGSATLTFTHSVTVEEAAQYLDELDRVAAGAPPTSSMPEFGLIEKLSLLVDEIGKGSGAGAGRAILGDSSAAAALKPGEGISLELSGGLEGGISGSGQTGGIGASIGASGGKAYTRKLDVQKTVEGKVAIAVTFQEVTTTGLKGGVEASGVSLDAKRTTGDSEGKTVKFLLKVGEKKLYDYDAVFSEIAAAMSLEELEKLQSKYKKLESERTVERGGEVGTGVEVGTRGLALGEERKAAVSEAVTVKQGEEGKPADLEAQLEGGSRYKFGLTLGGLPIATSSLEGKAVAEVKGGELSLDIQQTEGAGGALGPAIPKQPDDRSALEQMQDGIGMLLSASPKELLKQKLEQEYQILRGYKVSPADVQALVRRAADKKRFMAASGPYARVDLALANLRLGLLHPAYDPEFADVDPAQAKLLAQARAVTQFMAAAEKADAGGGYATFENLLRHFDRDEDEFGRKLAKYDELADQYEWTPETMPLKQSYDMLVEAVAVLPDELAQLEDKPNAYEQGTAKGQLLAGGLATLWDSLRRAEFGDQRAKLETMSRVSDLKLQAAAALTEFQTRVNEKQARLHSCEADPLDPGTTWDPGAATADEAQAQGKAPGMADWLTRGLGTAGALQSQAITGGVDREMAASAEDQRKWQAVASLLGAPAPEPLSVGADVAQARATTPEGRLALERVKELKRILFMCKQEEIRMFDRAREDIEDHGRSVAVRAVRIMNGEMKDLDNYWVGKILELRQAYREAGVPESAWEVSTGPRTPRRLLLEPDAATRRRLALQAAKGYGVDAEADRWVSFSREY